MIIHGHNISTESLKRTGKAMNLMETVVLPPPDHSQEHDLANTTSKEELFSLSDIIFANARGL